jgi:hypothetical protein
MGLNGVARLSLIVATALSQREWHPAALWRPGRTSVSVPNGS